MPDIEVFFYFGSLLLLIHFCSSFILSWLFVWIAKKLDIVDSSSRNPSRKKQKQPVPLLGGAGFILSSLFFTGYIWMIRKNFVTKAFPDFLLQKIALTLENLTTYFLNIYIFFNPNYNFDISDILNVWSNYLASNLEPFQLMAIFVAVAILMFAGFLDDKFQFSSKVMIAPIFIAIFIAVFVGQLKIESWSYPFNQIIPDIVFLHYFLAFFWIGLCTSATKFLDGHDGLVSSIGIITFLSIAVISLQVNQPLVFFLACIWAVGIAGFLPFNFPDAKSYLGEGGALTIGFMIGVLSILSGAKVASTSSALGLFIYDFIFVIALRLAQGKKPLEGDTNHWHFRLFHLGLSKLQVLSITVLIILQTTFFGLILPTSQKVWILIGQGVFLLGLFALTEKYKKTTKKID